MAKRSEHTLAHAIYPRATGCTHSMAEILRCVVCGRDLKAGRQHVDTCGERCSKRLARWQAAAAETDGVAP
jgi:hypothetical protein